MEKVTSQALDSDVLDVTEEGRVWYAVLQLAIPGAEEDHRLPLRIEDPHCLLKPGSSWELGPFGEYTPWKLTIYGSVQPPECAEPRRVLIEESVAPGMTTYTGVTKRVRRGGTHSIEGRPDAEGMVVTLAELFAPSLPIT